MCTTPNCVAKRTGVIHTQPGKKSPTRIDPPIGFFCKGVGDGVSSEHILE